MFETTEEVAHILWKALEFAAFDKLALWYLCYGEWQ